jgi:hypothetical protein
MVSEKAAQPEVTSRINRAADSGQIKVGEIQVFC